MNFVKRNLNLNSFKKECGIELWFYEYHLNKTIKETFEPDERKCKCANNNMTSLNKDDVCIHTFWQLNYLIFFKEVLWEI